jgi:pyrroloquinoline quinone biosynthesis protein E
MTKAGLSVPDASAGSQPASPLVAGPLWINAEITYKCPLHCVFCYNPLDYASTFDKELTTDQWLKTLREARELGAVQLGLSGGEPLMRDDLEIIIAEASNMGYYVNLLTSGVGLTEKRIAAFKAGGLDQIQLSFQDSTKELNDFLSDAVEAFVSGNINDPYLRKDYRIVEVSE